MSYRNIHLPIVLVVVYKGHCLLNYDKIGAKSLYSTCLQSFVYVCIQVIELQELAYRIVMYGPKLFFVVFQKRRCLHKFYYAYFLRVTKLYHLTKFQMLVYSG